MVHNIVSRGQDARHFVLDPIKITSPDQFVPLYLITEFPHIGHPYTNNFGRMKDRRVNALSTTPNTREQLKSILSQLLNHPYPKEYSLTIPTDSYDNWTGYDSTLARAFTGATDLVLGDAVVKLGLVICLGATRSHSYTCMKTSMYRSIVIEQFGLSAVNPQVAILVKAKHIPRLRARYYLNLKYDVPSMDIKMLVSTSVDRTLYDKITRLSGDYSRCLSEGLKVESVDTSILASYLYPPFVLDKPRAQYLKDARKLAEEMSW